MKLYADPVATTSRAVLALCHHEKLPVTLQPVALMKGEHHQPQFAGLNPNCLVPVLAEDDFVLTEASAIMRYLARCAGSALYPQDARRQARIDESMAWFESNFYKDFGYQYVYPQVLPHFRRSSIEATRATIEWGREQSLRWLAVLENHFLGHGKDWLLGDTLTIADFFGGSIVSLGELVNCSFDGYPNVQRWNRALGRLESWQEANHSFRGFAQALAGQEFVDLRRAADARAA